MVSLFESKNWDYEHYGLKLISGKSCFPKIPGFLKIGHFFCPFLSFTNTFQHSKNPKNRYYSQSNLKKLYPHIEIINAKLFINENC
jgi:hypothetical protein